MKSSLLKAIQVLEKKDRIRPPTGSDKSVSLAVSHILFEAKPPIPHSGLHRGSGKGCTLRESNHV